jgi:hypothetical protein
MYKRLPAALSGSRTAITWLDAKHKARSFVTYDCRNSLKAELQHGCTSPARVEQDWFVTGLLVTIEWIREIALGGRAGCGRRDRGGTWANLAGETLYSNTQMNSGGITAYRILLTTYLAA